MWTSTQNAFLRFTAELEGTCLWMYLDVEGLVTTGIGNLINAPDAAIKFNNWYHRNGTPATDQEVINEWNVVKALQSHSNDDELFWKDRAVLMMNPTETDKKVLAMAKQVETYVMLRPQMHSYCNWPADAQMAVLSMEWAMGDGHMSSYHKFLACANRNDFTGMADECYMDDTHNPGLIKRNLYNKALFENAARVINLGIDPSLYFGPTGPVVKPISMPPVPITAIS